MKGGKSGISQLIYEAAGDELDQETKKLYKHPAVIGQVYPVPLPDTSPLFQKEGVGFVIHCLPPNMNEKRPDCLKGDYEKGSVLLKQCYTNLFETFGKLALEK